MATYPNRAGICQLSEQFEEDTYSEIVLNVGRTLAFSDFSAVE